MGGSLVSGEDVEAASVKEEVEDCLLEDEAPDEDEEAEEEDEVFNAVGPPPLRSLTAAEAATEFSSWLVMAV